MSPARAVVSIRGEKVAKRASVRWSQPWEHCCSRALGLVEQPEDCKQTSYRSEEHEIVRTTVFEGRKRGRRVSARDLRIIRRPSSRDAAPRDGGGVRGVRSTGWLGIDSLVELLAILLMCGAAIALAWRLRRGIAGAWATLAGAATVAFASLYAVFIAVDGVALGVMVDRWAQAGPDQQGALFETAFAVRQIEAGLFGIQWLVFGIAAALFAGAFFASRETPSRRTWLRGMGWLSLLAAIGAISFGIAQAHSGFTETSMAFQTGLLPGFVWIAAVAVFLYRYPDDGRLLDEASWIETDEEREAQAVSNGVRGAAR